MDAYHFKNFGMLDPEAGELRGGHELVVEGDTIREVSARPIKLAAPNVIDCGGRTLMPGLIDSHVHVVLSEVSIRNLESIPLTLMTARAAALMRGMLNRGFTSVRDTGGADWGLKEATDKGLLRGPRLFIAGRAIGPTGGHSDSRRRTDFGTRCHCCNAMAFSMGIADGVTEVRRAVREEMRQGCDQVKIMMSASLRPTTRSTACNFRSARSRPPCRRRTPLAAMFVLTPTRRKPSRAQRTPACVPSSTAI